MVLAKKEMDFLSSLIPGFQAPISNQSRGSRGSRGSREIIVQEEDLDEDPKVNARIDLIRQLREEIRSLEERKVRYEQELQHAKEQYDTFNEVWQPLVAGRTQQNDRLIRQIEERENELQRLQEQHSRLEQELIGSMSTLKQLVERIESLQQEVDELLSEKEQLVGVVQQLKGMREELSHLDAEIRKRQVEWQQLMRQSNNYFESTAENEKKHDQLLDVASYPEEEEEKEKEEAKVDKEEEEKEEHEEEEKKNLSPVMEATRVLPTRVEGMTRVEEKKNVSEDVEDVSDASGLDSLYLQDSQALLPSGTRVLLPVTHTSSDSEPSLFKRVMATIVMGALFSLIALAVFKFKLTEYNPVTRKDEWVILRVGIVAGALVMGLIVGWVVYGIANPQTSTTSTTSSD